MKAANWTIRTFLVLGTALVLAPVGAQAATHKVVAGQSIQAAIDAAAAGDKILVYPGTYQEPHLSGPGLHVTKPLQLQAKTKPGEVVRLLAGPGQTDGVLAEGVDDNNRLDGFRIKGFLIEGFPKNGIHLRYVNNFKIERNESKNNLENGIFPTLSANGQVKRNLSYGSEDSALWVEASTDVRVLQNELHSSPTGLEVTVSNNVEIKGNNIHDNTTGVGLYHPSAASLPPLAEMGNWVITKNWIHDNNFPNNAPPGSMPASLPPGGGILVLGTDFATIENNIIENNDFYGVTIIDYCIAVGGSAFDCGVVPPDIEPYPKGNRVQKNTFTNNGTEPVVHPLAEYAADLIYIQFETGNSNCIGKNQNAEGGAITKSFPFLQPNVQSKCG
jgi:hypothetical protein